MIADVTNDIKVAMICGLMVRLTAYDFAQGNIPYGMPSCEVEGYTLSVYSNAS